MKITPIQVTVEELTKRWLGIRTDVYGYSSA